MRERCIDSQFDGSESLLVWSKMKVLGAGTRETRRHDPEYRLHHSHVPLPIIVP